MGRDSQGCRCEGGIPKTTCKLKRATTKLTVIDLLSFDKLCSDTTCNKQYTTSNKQYFLPDSVVDHGTCYMPVQNNRFMPLEPPPSHTTTWQCMKIWDLWWHNTSYWPGLSSPSAIVSEYLFTMKVLTGQIQFDSHITFHFIQPSFSHHSIW